MTGRSVASDTRRRILGAAARVFAAKGYAASRVGDIAAEARVAHGLLYHYFSSKEEVLRTVLDETWDALLGAVAEAESARPPPPAVERLGRIAGCVLQTWAERPDAVRVLVHESWRPGHDERGARELLAALERVVAEGQGAGELRGDLQPRLVARLLLGAVREVVAALPLATRRDAPARAAGAESAVLALLRGGLVPVAAAV